MNKASELLWRTAFNIVFRGYYKVKVFGRENVPKKGALIVSPNHASYYDPPLMGMALPRHVSFMAKEELFKNPFLKPIIQWLGAFPVRRGAVDKVAIRKAMDIVKQGNLLGIFPEGKRSKPGRLGAFHDGVASMALRTGTAILPVAIIGSDKMTIGKVGVALGKPIEVAKAKPTEEAIHALNETLRAAMLDLYETYASKL